MGQLVLTPQQTARIDRNAATFTGVDGPSVRHNIPRTNGAGDLQRRDPEAGETRIRRGHAKLLALLADTIDLRDFGDRANRVVDAIEILPELTRSVVWSAHGEQHRDDVAKVAVDDRSLDGWRKVDRMQLVHVMPEHRPEAVRVLHPLLELHVHDDDAVTRGGERLELAYLLMAKEPFLDLAGDLLLDLRRCGARVTSEHEARADRDLWIFAARHREQRAHAEQHSESREDEDDGAILEGGANGVHCLTPPRMALGAALSVMSCTSAPSRKRCWPATTMRSPLVRPLVISSESPRAVPVVTRRAWTRESALSSVYTIVAASTPPLCSTAAAGTSSALTL